MQVTVVRDFNDLMRVFAVRSAVYISGQNCPFDEEFDGNDLCATHLLGWSGREPVASLRIRFFAEFAKVERLAVREAFRQSSIAFQIVRKSIWICRMKGYSKIYGHAQNAIMPFWKRFGSKELEGAQPFSFSGHDYTEMIFETSPHPNAVRIGGNPFIVIRPEGEWENAGVLERSASAQEPGEAATARAA